VDVVEDEVVDFLRRKLDKTSIILGPSTALNFRLKNVYRFNITIKYRFDNNLQNTLKDLDDIFSTNKDVFLEIDLNPLQL